MEQLTNLVRTSQQAVSGRGVPPKAVRFENRGLIEEPDMKDFEIVKNSMAFFGVEDNPTRSQRRQIVNSHF